MSHAQADEFSILLKEFCERRKELPGVCLLERPSILADMRSLHERLLELAGEPPLNGKKLAIRVLIEAFANGDVVLDKDALVEDYGRIVRDWRWTLIRLMAENIVKQMRTADNLPAFKLTPYGVWAYAYHSGELKTESAAS